MGGFRRLVACGLLLLGTLACAGEPTPPDPGVDSREERARLHFDLGTRAYAAQDYETALLEFEAARRLLPRPAFDFNIGRAYERHGEDRKAIEAYERYLAAAPTAADADKVREWVAALKRR